MARCYNGFQKGERLGTGSIRDLFNALLSEAESEKNVLKVNDLLFAVLHRQLFARGKAEQIYEEITVSMLCWMKENCVLDEAGNAVSFKGE